MRERLAFAMLRVRKGGEKLGVYVDAARVPWRGRSWSHLTADSVEELHAFAAQLSLKRAWFQGAGRLPHYDLTERKRAEALTAGAVAETARERRERLRNG